MKKKLLVLVMALASAAALTGCEKKEDKKDEGGNASAETKTLACSAKEDDEEVKYSFTFSGDSITKVVYTSTTTYESEKAAKKANEDDSKDIDDMGKMKGVLANAQLSGKKTVNTLTFNVNELDDTSKSFYKSVMGDLDNKTYNDVKSTFETALYTCK